VRYTSLLAALESGVLAAPKSRVVFKAPATSLDEQP
jgi:hypothetical protein